MDIVNGTLQVGPNLADGLPAAVPMAPLDIPSLNRAQAAIYLIESRNYTPYSDQWGLTVQQRLKRRLALEAALTSSMGIHLITRYNSNTPAPAPTPYPFHRYPFDPYTSRIDYLSFSGGSTYYGGQLKLTGEVVNGLEVQAFYQYSKSLDDATQPFTDQQSRPPSPQFIYYPRGVRSPSPFDIAQRMVLTAAYDLPFKNPPARGGFNASRVLREALANWRIATVVTVQTGLPFTPQLALNGLNDGGFQLPNRIRDGSLPADQRSYLHWFNTSLDPADPNHAFVTPPPYQYGNSGFDILRGPGLATVDASVARSFALTERLRLQTRLEIFNSLNHVNFGLPNRILGLPSSGVIDHTSTPSRQMQLVGRLEW
jgi:hypothetical protein